MALRKVRVARRSSMVKDRDLVLQRGLFVGEAPGHPFFTDPCQAGQEAAHQFTRLCPAGALEARLLSGEGVAKGRAYRLVDRAPHVFVAERRLGQVAMVHVAGEHDDGRRGRPFSPAPTTRIRSVSSVKVLWNELQWSRSWERRILSPHPAARAPHAPEHTASFHACA